MSTDDHGTKCHRNVAENYNRLSRVHERYRETDDRRTGDGSERERSYSLKTYCTKTDNRMPATSGGRLNKSIKA